MKNWKKEKAGFLLKTKKEKKGFLLKTKKGAAHVEMIISFVIFISFVAFMLVFFKPAKTADSSAMETTEKRVIEHISADLTMASLILNSSFSATSGKCIGVKFQLQSRISAKSEDMNAVDARRDNEYVYLKYNGQRVYKIYSSEEIEEKTFDITGCVKLNKTNYTVGVARTYKKVAYSNLTKFSSDYLNNYENLKKALGLTNDFTFSVRRDSGAVLFEGKRNIPSGINIISKDIPIEIFDKNANLNQTILNLKVWG